MSHGGVPAGAPRPAISGDWSGDTNSLKVALGIRHPGQECGYELAVALRQTSPGTDQLAAERLSTPVNGAGQLHHPYAPGARYFLSTNSFWGVVELYDSAGRPVSLLDPQRGGVEAYPLSYRLSAAHASLSRQYEVYSGPPLPIAITPDTGSLVYDLEKFFKLKRAGRYHLKLWPKIYRRNGPGTDTCTRLDLTPVTVDFDVD